MRNLKELKAILTSIYCLNFIKDSYMSIDALLEYTFKRILECNTNLITYAMVGQSKEEIIKAVKQILKEDTKFNTEEIQDA